MRREEHIMYMVYVITVCFSGIHHYQMYETLIYIIRYNVRYIKKLQNILLLIVNISHSVNNQIMYILFLNNYLIITVRESKM